MTAFEPQGQFFQASVAPLMGTRLEFLCVGTPEEVIRPLWDGFEARAQSLSAMLDRFRAESEVSRINALAAMHPIRP